MELESMAPLSQGDDAGASTGHTTCYPAPQHKRVVPEATYKNGDSVVAPRRERLLPRRSPGTSSPRDVVCRRMLRRRGNHQVNKDSLKLAYEQLGTDDGSSHTASTSEAPIHGFSVEGTHNDTFKNMMDHLENQLGVVELGPFVG